MTQDPGQYPGYGQYSQYPGYGRPAAPKPGIIPLRPLTAGEILDGAFTAMRWNPKAILVASAVVAAISGVLTTVVGLILRHDVFTDVVNFPDTSNGQVTVTGHQVLNFLGLTVALGGVTLVFTFLTSTILTGVITVAVAHAVLGRKETLGASWRATRSRLGPLLGLVFLAALFIGLGWVLIVGMLVLIAVLFGTVAHLLPLGVLIAVLGGITATVFAVIVTVRWSLAIPVVMLEGRSPLASLGRSWQLVRGSSWRVFGISLLVQLVVGIASAVIQAPFTFADGGSFFTTAAAHPAVTGTLIAAIGGIIASTVTAPLSAGAVVLLYADLRMRKEGMDIVLQAAAASAGSAGTLGQPDGQNLGPW